MYIFHFSMVFNLLKKIRSNGPQIRPCVDNKEFCQDKKNQKIREKLGSEWVGRGPTQIFIFLGEILCFLVLLMLLSCFQMFQKRKQLFNLREGFDYFC